MQAQIQWEDCPRKDGGDYAWTMVQTPEKGTLEVICISPSIVGCMVHFWSGRTVGCTGPECEACAKNRVRFWEGYIAAMRSRSFDRVIVRLTEKIGGKINSWLAGRRTLRGAVMQFDRPSRTKNGRIRLNIEQEPAKLPEKITNPAMREVLCHIWRLHAKPEHLEADHPTKIIEPANGGPQILLASGDGLVKRVS